MPDRFHLGVGDSKLRFFLIGLDLYLYSPRHLLTMCLILILCFMFSICFRLFRLQRELYIFGTMSIFWVLSATMQRQFCQSLFQHCIEQKNTGTSKQASQRLNLCLSSYVFFMVYFHGMAILAWYFVYNVL